MTRFAFTFFLLLLSIGCQTAAHGPKPTIIARAPQPATSVKQFWNRTARFLQPLMPDTGNPAESDSHFAAGCSHSDILPINHTPHSLYKAGSILPSPLLTLQKQEEHVSTTETAVNVTANTGSSNPNPLRPQTTDSETFKSLLHEIAATPADKRKVNDTKLAELLTSFRNEIGEAKDSDFEAEHLALLRKRILPEAGSSKSVAPLPEEELITETKRPVKSPVRKRNTEEYDEDFYEEPVIRPVAKKTLQNREEPAIAQSSIPKATPVYPSLTQLPNAVPATVQASYQQSLPPYTHNISGYGAGDWQAPTRQAIEQLRYAIEQTPNGRTMSNEMRLRLMEMVLGNKAEAAKPIQSADKTVNGFMGNQVLGFAALLDDSIQDNRGRYISAAYRLNEGLQELQNLCPLKLKNVTFVKNWFGYGQFVPHVSDFHPGEKFLIYMELENPTIRRATEGFEVSVAISYEIRDAHANIVVKQEAGKPIEMTLSRKRDYCLGIDGTLPTSLAPGQYQLRISVSDLNDDSMQYAEEQIPLRVVPAQASEQ